MHLEDIEKSLATIPATLKEKRGLYAIEFTVAERKAFLSRKRLTYSARFRIDRETKEVRFTEMLSESGAGAYSGLDDSSSGFGFKKETYRIGGSARDGTIEEQSRLFAKEYSYTFDLSRVRGILESAASKAGYAFRYQTTTHGL